MPQERQRRAASGSASAAHSNRVLIDTMREALGSTDVPVDAICAVPGLTHDSVMHLTRARGIVDVVIPRGARGSSATSWGEQPGAGDRDRRGQLSRLPARGRVGRSRVAIVVNSKTQRVSVCNTAEALLVHEAAAERLLPEVFAALKERGVTIHGDEISEKYAQSTGISFRRATDLDWAEEYLSLDLAVRVVRDEQDAIDHITKWSSGHTEAV